MSILNNIYQQKLTENYQNLRFWEDYLRNLQELDFSNFTDKLKVPVLVPIGSRILFRGELKHTNEVMVSMGADYFTKCSVKQAEVLREHRIKDAQSKVGLYKKERDFFESQFSLHNEQILPEHGHDIIEEYNEDEDKKWRKKHKDNLKTYRKNKSNKDNKSDDNDEELWNRLEELELQEELENELKKNFVTKEEKIEEKHRSSIYRGVEQEEIHTVPNDTLKNIHVKSKVELDILQKVLNKQHELEQKLFDLKNNKTGRIKTEQDLIAKLDELDELDELEDEIDRLDVILEDEDFEEEEETEVEETDLKSSMLKKSISFADENDSESLDILFTHSSIQPDSAGYNKDKGITKPSDIYEAFSNNLKTKTSILKKSKYEKKQFNDKLVQTKIPLSEIPETDEHIPETNRTIVVKDIAENVNIADNALENYQRPVSVFKMRRQQRNK